VKFDAQTIATILFCIVVIGLLAVGAVKLFVIDYRVRIIQIQVNETNSNTRLFLGRSLYDWTPTPKEEELE